MTGDTLRKHSKSILGIIKDLLKFKPFQLSSRRLSKCCKAFESLVDIEDHLNVLWTSKVYKYCLCIEHIISTKKFYRFIQVIPDIENYPHRRLQKSLRNTEDLEEALLTMKT